MKRKALMRGLSGFPEGIAIGTVITIVISLIKGNGSYYPCVPDFVSFVGNEIMAVIIQTIIWGLLGSIFGTASIICSMEGWSIARQRGVYFIIGGGAIMTAGYILRWMPYSIYGAIGFLMIFFAVFLIVWLANYLFFMIKIKKLNRNIEMNDK